jgi:iron complex outermembrane receptor protein
MDQRLFVSASAFRTIFRDFQSSVIKISGLSTVNLDKVAAQGIELEFMAKPSADFQFSGGLAFNDATVDKFDSLAQCYDGQTTAQGCMETAPGTFGQSLEGYDLPNSPDWSGNLSSNYTFYRNNETEAFVQATYSWRSKALFDLDGDPKTEQDAYGLLSGRIGFTDKNKGYEIALWGKNLTDETYSNAIFENLIFLTGYSQFLGMGRQVGLDINIDF